MKLTYEVARARLLTLITEMTSARPTTDEAVVLAEVLNELAEEFESVAIDRLVQSAQLN